METNVRLLSRYLVIQALMPPTQAKGQDNVPGEETGDSALVPALTLTLTTSGEISPGHTDISLTSLRPHTVSHMHHHFHQEKRFLFHIL